MTTPIEDSDKPVSAADGIGQLLDAYRATKRRLDDSPDAFERTLGYAALQSHARDAARHLNTSAGGVTAADLEQLKSFAEDLTIARAARGPIGWGMESAKSAFTATNLPLAAGGLAIVATVVAFISRAGGSAGKLLYGGGGTILLFCALMVVRGATGQLSKLWKHAKTVGSEFESAYSAHAEPAEQQLWASAQSRPPSGMKYVPKVRLCAMGGVIALWAVLIVCGGIFAYSMLSTFSQLTTDEVNAGLRFP